MAKRHPYEGGAWEIGGVLTANYRARMSQPPDVLRADLERSRDHALKRIGEGNQQYRLILREIDAQLDKLKAAETAPNETAAA